MGGAAWQVLEPREKKEAIRKRGLRGGTPAHNEGQVGLNVVS